jgi:hypothetical protein
VRGRSRNGAGADDRPAAVRPPRRPAGGALRAGGGADPTAGAEVPSRAAGPAGASSPSDTARSSGAPRAKGAPRAGRAPRPEGAARQKGQRRTASVPRAENGPVSPGATAGAPGITAESWTAAGVVPPLRAVAEAPGERTDLLDGIPLDLSDLRSGSKRRRTRRPVAPPAHPVFRWGVPVVLLVLALVVVNLAFDAKDLVLNSRDGAISRTVTDPSAEGFAAEVVSTPTLLVMQTSDAGKLVGVSVMSLASSEGGGTVAVFNEDLIVKDAPGGSGSLGQIYDRGGPEALKKTVTRLIDADVDAVVNVGATVLEELIRPVAPLSYTLRDNVRVVQNGAAVTVLRSGPVSIAGVEQIRAATEVLGPDEATVNRVARQMAFWEAWFAALRAVPDKSAVLPVYDSPIVRFAKTLGSGTTRVVQVPFEQTTFQGSVLHIADAAATRQLAQQMIPYPKGYEPGARLLVELRNGTGDLARNEPVIAKIVRSGGELVLLGNTDQFGVVSSSVTFYDEGLRSRVEAFARQIGIPNVVLADRPGSSIEVTVTIGADITR